MTRQVITCLGAGRMGRGIAHAMAWAGHDVRLLDAKARDDQAYAAFVKDCLTEIRKSLEDMAALGACDLSAVSIMMARVQVYALADADQALADCDYVFEGVPEIVAAKADAFALVDTYAPDTVILASTTSTILSTELAGHTKRPTRFLNAHFLNPAWLVPLVELSPADETDPAVTEALKVFLDSMGKQPVTCKAAPGYIVPRIQALAMNEAARLVEEGVASAEDVDKAVKYGFGLRFAVLGLLEFIDWGGGDILHYASKYMAEATGEDRFAAPDIIRQNMEQDRLGLRSGKGFYDYENVDVDAYRKDRMQSFLAMVRQAGSMRDPVLEE